MNTHDPRPIDRLAKLVDDVSDYILAEREAGRTELEVDPALLGKLRTWPEASPPPPPPPATDAKTPISPKGSATKPTATTAMDDDAIRAALEDIAQRVSVCTLCDLCHTRNHTVPGQGSIHPDIMFVGEGPGADEDKTGEAFVGRAGKLLTKIIEAMGYTRDEVWIGNIVKCRPPNNRTPSPEEMEACMPYLLEQIALLKPKVIVCLGATALKGLLNTQEGISKLRGQWMQFEGIDTMPTYHPAYLLRNPSAKRMVWDDMKAVLKRLGRKPPER